MGLRDTFSDCTVTTGLGVGVGVGLFVMSKPTATDGAKVEVKPEAGICSGKTPLSNLMFRRIVGCSVGVANDGASVGKVSTGAKEGTLDPLIADGDPFVATIADTRMTGPVKATTKKHSSPYQEHAPRGVAAGGVSVSSSQSFSLGINDFQWSSSVICASRSSQRSGLSL